jgi:hypothetical protein
MGGLLTLPSFEAQFPETAGGFAGSRSSTLQSLLVAICESAGDTGRSPDCHELTSEDELGCMAGALSNLYVGDRLGRRHTITL